MQYQDKTQVFWPREITFKDILLNSAGVFISWTIWSFLMFFLVVLFSQIINLQAPFKENWLNEISPIFPFVFSFIVFFSLIIVSNLSYLFLCLYDPLKYKKTIVHFGQTALLNVIIYIFILPLYVFAWRDNPQFLINIFIWHSIVNLFWIWILIEILNNYRYVLVWFFSGFVSLFLTTFVVYIIFSSFWDAYAKFLSLLFLLPLINILTFFFKNLFEFVYYKYYLLTWYDQLWDIFRQIEIEEEEERKNAELQTSQF